MQMDRNLFVTITGTNYYYDMKPYEVDKIIKLVKEPDNKFDHEAVHAELPHIGIIGYVANSTNTVARGTMSAGRLYDHFNDYCFAQVLFIADRQVICLVIIPQEEKAADKEVVPGEVHATCLKYEKPRQPMGF
jgi:hypothetical protein